MAAASFIGPAHRASDSAFGNLIDLARLRAGTSRAEVCKVCNTINMDWAHLCKCCAHKLPAFYAGERPSLLAAHGRRFAGRRRDLHRLLVVHFVSPVEALL